MLCSRCNKRMAVVFIQRIESDKSINEGICLTCAKEMGIKPVSEFMEKMGISDEEIDSMNESLMEYLGDANADGFEPGGAPAAFPFLQNIFSDNLNLSKSQNNENNKSKDNRSNTSQGQKDDKKDKKKSTKFLDAYSINLTAMAREGKLDRIIGRERELHRVIQILSRRSKNNPCLIGEPGVGKTAIAEALAIRIAEGKVPDKLSQKEIYLLDLTALVAGTQFRGQFESRVKGLVEEVRNHGNAILFIDEVHNLVGAGDSAEGSMNAANILKPALSRGEIQVIGATTFNEYRKHIEKDAALERRFQSVTIEEPSISDSVNILLGIKGYYEEYHHVKIPDNIITKAVNLSERYITDRFLPDKAIDLLDEAAAACSLAHREISDYQSNVRKLISLKQKEDALNSDPEALDYEEIAKVRSEIIGLDSKIQLLKNRADRVQVTEDDLARVIEMWTGIPATKIKESGLKKLSTLEENIKKKVVGQDEAIELVAAAIKRARTGVSPRRKPASFIFAGPTGVGKTELAKTLSAELFDTPETLVRLDMSEFMEKHSVSRIIGAPPGYVGYDEAGQLTEKIRRKPYSVILLDEIEKAHPDVMNILLQILDEGRLTDAHGRRVNFENTVIIMTTNAGSEQRDGLVGFEKSIGSMAKDKVMKSLSEFLRPEFLSRVDEIVIFNQLTVGDYEKIADILLTELKSSLSEKGIMMSWDQDVLALIAKKSHGKKSGARDLVRTIRKEIENPIASVLAENYDSFPKFISVTVNDNAFAIISEAIRVRI